MAKSVEPFTWEKGFQEPSTGTPWVYECASDDDDDDDGYTVAPSVEVVTSEAHNELGINVLRTWPTIYDGTNNPHGVPEWWSPASEVDVVICGAGPSGLEVALSLVRQGVSFRIIDKAAGPLIAGRADGVQPRFLEILHTWGLAKEVHEEGPLIERTAIYRDGKKILFGRSHQCDSRYRGLHIITQGQIERIYVRDLLRHRVLVERSTTLKDFRVGEGGEYPVDMTIINERTGKEDHIRSKFLVGSDGAASSIRKKLDIPFDGVSTGIYWGIMDCVFETDYPHAWIFGSVISTEHGGCVIIPREDGYIRLYTQLDVSATGALAASRQAGDPTFAEAGGRVDIHSIKPEEVLEQANKIFSPYKLKFAAPLSWFAIWKISERVARNFSSKDLRVHLAGDAAHVHSVMGAFGLNASIMDASNLAWKMGLACKGRAKLDTIMATYNYERRDHACRIIEASGEYLRFVCNAAISIAHVRDPEEFSKHLPDGTSAVVLNGSSEKNGSGHIDGRFDEDATTNNVGSDQSPTHTNTNGVHKVNGFMSSEKNNEEEEQRATEEHQRDKDLQFLGNFFGRNGKFLLGVDAPFGVSSITHPENKSKDSVVNIKNGVRAPNPRVCFSADETGYLYDRMTGAATFHLILFASSLRGGVRRRVSTFASQVLGNNESFYHQYGGSSLFNILVVVKCLPDEVVDLMDEPALDLLRETGTIVYDDRAPDEDAHTTYRASHRTGAVVVVRPDLWVGTSALPDDIDLLESYFGDFLLRSR